MKMAVKFREWTALIGPLFSSPDLIRGGGHAKITWFGRTADSSVVWTIKTRSGGGAGPVWDGRGMLTLPNDTKSGPTIVGQRPLVKRYVRSP
jgi:hypothetical protein